MIVAEKEFGDVTFTDEYGFVSLRRWPKGWRRGRLRDMSRIALAKAQLRQPRLLPPRAIAKRRRLRGILRIIPAEGRPRHAICRSIKRVPRGILCVTRRRRRWL